MKIFFYPHEYLRDRQIDTIRNWPPGEVVNPELAAKRVGAQVSANKANAARVAASWKQRLPLLNIKMRPSNAPKDAVVYLWGALVLSGNFIVDLDNPWSLVGYNLSAMPIFRSFIRRILLSDRCYDIRCMSNACRESLKLLFGSDVYNKASIHYPCLEQSVASVDSVCGDITHFLFVGTQFEIKGGEALLRAFSRVYSRNPNCRLDIVTHMPEHYVYLANSCPGVVVHEAHYIRREIHEEFMRNADVLVLPTYVESFGMVALEALAHGLALIVTDVYALAEMVEHHVNGILLQPPISIWDGYLPSEIYKNIADVKKYIREIDKSGFEINLENAMESFVLDPTWLLQARKASTHLMKERFAC
ncbi:glycosyltransferase family 4 protein [Thiomicrospira sp.]|uniref:glycosyltransferase family 4 protein n=1 Tax=Thiomicrospira sp. TaxID=935 RepID=UPI002F9410A5